MQLTDVIFTTCPSQTLRELLAGMEYDRLFVIMPRVCAHLLTPALPGLKASLLIDDHEQKKTLRGLEIIMSAMLEQRLTRNSVVVNVGGGVTTDIGGLAAALYMRGIRYINLPTTLLAMVDASSGGKTAVDFHGIKNIIGAFHQPSATVISTKFLETLPYAQLLSGYAEMLKHDLLRGVIMPDAPLPPAIELVEESVRFKHRIVTADPTEKGLRRILNLGHTAGHAFEALALTQGHGVPHGIAVAQGLVTALVLSTMTCGFSSAMMQRIVGRIQRSFPVIPFTCRNYDELLRLMHNDKKNQGKGSIAFTLLSEPGHPVESLDVSDEVVREALDITRDLLGI